MIWQDATLDKRERYILLIIPVHIHSPLALSLRSKAQ
jgi:hypothetical protein